VDNKKGGQKEADLYFDRVYAESSAKKGKDNKRSNLSSVFQDDSLIRDIEDVP
jgi:hypothetical protein